MKGKRWVQMVLDFRDREWELAQVASRVERIARLLEAEPSGQPGFIGTGDRARLKRLTDLTKQ